jgi:hypothetical protein
MHKYVNMAKTIIFMSLSFWETASPSHYLLKKLGEVKKTKVGEGKWVWDGKLVRLSQDICGFSLKTLELKCDEGEKSKCDQSKTMIVMNLLKSEDGA